MWCKIRQKLEINLDSIKMTLLCFNIILVICQWDEHIDLKFCVQEKKNLSLFSRLS